MVTFAKPQIVVLGAGGHARVIAGILAAMNVFELVGFLDRVEPKVAETIGDGCVLGSWDALPDYRSRAEAVALAIGDNRARAEMFARVKALGYAVPALTHPRAVVDPTATINEGAVICTGSIVCVNAVIGRNAIINSGAIVDHETVVGDHAHVGPGCRIAGRVTIGDRTFIGVGTSVRDRVTVGCDVIVGAGSVVVADIPDGVTAFGVPAKVRSAAIPGL